MIDQSKIELELAKIERSIGRKEKYHFMSQVYSLLEDILIDTVPSYIKREEYTTPKKNGGVKEKIILFGNLSRILDKEGVFKNKKYFNKNYIDSISQFRNDCIHGGFEPNNAEIYFIYTCVKRMLEEIGYKTAISKELCNGCSRAWVKEDRLDNLCKWCGLREDLLLDYMRERKENINSNISSIRQMLRQMNSRSAPHIEEERIGKIFNTLYNEINKNATEDFNWITGIDGCFTYSEKFKNYLEEKLQQEKGGRIDDYADLQPEKLRRIDIKRFTDEQKKDIDLIWEEYLMWDTSLKKLGIILADDFDMIRHSIFSLYPELGYIQQEKLIKMIAILGSMDTLFTELSESVKRDGINGFFDSLHSWVTEVLPTYKCGEKWCENFIDKLLELFQE